MAEIKSIEKDRLNLIIAEKGFLPELLIKDYYITVLLYLLKDIRGIYFKGGTALQKTARTNFYRYLSKIHLFKNITFIYKFILFRYILI